MPHGRSEKPAARSHSEPPPRLRSQTPQRAQSQPPKLRSSSHSRFNLRRIFTRSSHEPDESDKPYEGKDPTYNVISNATHAPEGKGLLPLTKPHKDSDQTYTAYSPTDPKAEKPVSEFSDDDSPIERGRKGAKAREKEKEKKRKTKEQHKNQNAAQELDGQARYFRTHKNPENSSRGGSTSDSGTDQRRKPSPYGNDFSRSSSALNVGQHEAPRKPTPLPAPSDRAGLLTSAVRGQSAPPRLSSRRLKSFEDLHKPSSYTSKHPLPSQNPLSRPPTSHNYGSYGSRRDDYPPFQQIRPPQPTSYSVLSRPRADSAKYFGDPDGSRGGVRGGPVPLGYRSRSEDTSGGHQPHTHHTHTSKGHHHR